MALRFCLGWRVVALLVVMAFLTNNRGCLDAASPAGDCAPVPEAPAHHGGSPASAGGAPVVPALRSSG